MDNTITLITGFAVTLIALVTPIIKLNTTITKLNITIENLIQRFNENNKLIKLHDEKLMDHEIRIDRIERGK